MWYLSMWVPDPSEAQRRMQSNEEEPGLALADLEDLYRGRHGALEWHFCSSFEFPEWGKLCYGYGQAQAARVGAPLGLGRVVEGPRWHPTIERLVCV